VIVWSFFLSAFIALMGIVAYIVAPRIKPNPWFGFRVGYTLIDRDVWIKGNKFISKLFIADGALFTVLSLLLSSDALIPVLVLFEISVMACVIAAVIYVDDLAEKATGKRPNGDFSKIIPIRLDPKTVKYPVVLSVFYLILISTILLTVNLLPDVTAVHFNLQGVPDRYEYRWEFAISFIGVITLEYAFYIAFYLLARYKPLIFYKPKLGFSTTEFIKLLSAIYGMIFTVVGVGYTIIFAYNFYGYHLIPSYFIIFLVLGILLTVPIFVIKIARKKGRYG